MSIQINGTSGISGVDGSATTPALQGTDTNTGISFGTDEVNVVTGGTTRTTVDSSGRVLIGTTGVLNTGTGDDVHISSTVGANILLGRDDTVVTNSNNLGQIAAYSFHGSSWNESARIQFAADGAHAGSGDVPGRISFQVCKDGVAGVGEQMQLDNAGNLKFNSGYGSVATAYGVRAWVNFNGIGTVAIRGSGNVSSITDNGTGEYTVNFTTAMPDANYCAVVTHRNIDYGGTSWLFTASTVTTSSVKVASYDNAYYKYQDTEVFCVAVIR